LDPFNFFLVFDNSSILASFSYFSLSVFMTAIPRILCCYFKSSW